MPLAAETLLGPYQILACPVGRQLGNFLSPAKFFAISHVNCDRFPNQVAREEAALRRGVVGRLRIGMSLQELEAEVQPAVVKVRPKRL